MGNSTSLGALQENGNLHVLDLSKKLTPEDYLKVHFYS